MEQHLKEINNIGILLFGFTGSGKSTFCDYIKKRFGMGYVHVKRAFEKKYGVENAPLIYRNLINKYNDRSYYLNYLRSDLEYLKKNDMFVIEGLFTKHEVFWCTSFFNRKIVTVYIEIKNDDLRFSRYMEREKKSISEAKVGFDLSDEKRKRLVVHSMKEHSDFILYNDHKKEVFFASIDMFMAEIMSKDIR